MDKYTLYAIAIIAYTTLEVARYICKTVVAVMGSKSSSK